MNFLGAIDRRQALKLVAGAVMGAAVRPTYAFAQSGGANNLALWTLSQKLLLNKILYDDVSAYLAFEQVIRQKVPRGTAASNAFDAAYDEFSKQTPQRLSQSLNSAIGQGVALDCILVDQSSLRVSIASLFSSSIPWLGVAGTVARQIDGGLAADSDMESAEKVVQSITTLQFVPVVPSKVSSAFLQEQLSLVISNGGVFGMVAHALAQANEAQNVAADFQTQLMKVSVEIKNLTNSVGALNGTGAAASAANVQQMTANLSAAIVALGSVSGLDKETVQGVAKGVNVASSVLSGAMAGSSLGPVGASVGGVVGLLGGLFGGGGDDSDQTGQALARMDARISQLSQMMRLGFQQLSAQLTQDFAALSKQMQVGFNDLSAQIRSLETQVKQGFAQVAQLIVEKSATDLQTKLDAIVNAAREHEIQYRRNVVKMPSIYMQTESDVRTRAEELMDTSRIESLGFCSSAFTGDTTFEVYLQDYSDRLGKQLINAHLSPSRMIGNFDTLLGVNGPKNSIVDEISALESRLLDVRYGAGSETNGAALINGIQVRCVEQLAEFDSSKESRAIEQRPEITTLIPDLNSELPPPIAPQDLWRQMAAVQDALSLLSDTSVVQDVLSECVDFFRSRISAHYLLTGQNSIPALLYIRRRIGAQLARSAAVVFCNPYMAGIDVLRRVVSDKISADDNLKIDGTSEIKLTNMAEVRARLHEYSRDQMPLSNVTSVSLDGSDDQGFIVARPYVRTALPDGIQWLEELIEKMFLQEPIDPKLPQGVIVTESFYLTSAVDWYHETNVLTKPLVSAVSLIDKDATQPLAKHLEIVRASCMILGLIESCIRIRLKALALSVGEARVPVFAGWFEGFREYGVVACYALGQHETSPSGDLLPQSDELLAKGVMRALLGTPRSKDANIARVGTTPMPGHSLIPSGLTEEARPYPAQLGQFWGWGAEDARPDSPTPPELLEALLSPECAFAGENKAVLAAVETYSQMDLTLQILRNSSPLTDMMLQQMSQGTKQELRRHLAS